MYTKSLLNTLFDDMLCLEAEPIVKNYHIKTSKDKTTLEVDLTGFPPEYVNVSVEGSILKVVADIKKDNEEGLTARKVEKSWKLPNNIDVKNIDATLKYGLLSIIFSKKEEMKPKNIQIRT